MKKYIFYIIITVSLLNFAMTYSGSGMGFVALPVNVVAFIFSTYYYYGSVIENRSVRFVGFLSFAWTTLILIFNVFSLLTQWML